MDKALVKEIRDGNQLAFRKLVDQYKDLVLSACYGYVHNSQDAEDLAQEVFVEVHRSIDQFRGESKLSTWLYRIATTKSMDMIKSRQRQKRSAFFKSASLDDVNAQKHAEHETPHSVMEQQERMKVINDALDRIPEKQRITFTMSQYEGFSSKEIGEVLEMKANAVDALLFRARQNLKTLLTDYYEREMR